MDLKQSSNIPDFKSKEKDTVTLNFMTMEGKLIFSNQYLFENSLNEVIEDFLNKNNEITLKPYFDFDTFNKENLAFYAKKDESFKKIEFSKDNGKVLLSLNIDQLEDTVFFLGMEMYGSINTCANTNKDYLKIYVKYENKLKDVVNNFDDYIINTTSLIAKPRLNKLEYYLFDRYLNELKIIPCSKEDIKTNKINPFTLLDTYCNAKNFLYIYEGNSNDSIKFSKFFNINLVKNKINLISAYFPQRFLHSMIFIPSCYIFIIGGKNTKEVIYYEIKDNNNTYEKYPHLLPEELLEPSLITINNKYIYILENSTIMLNIYKVNIINLSPFEKVVIKNKNSVYVDQKFFGVVRNKNTILFLGGQMLNINKNNEIKNSFEFHFETNKLFRSKRIFTPSNFIEKTFIPVGDDIYIQFAEYKKGNKKELKMVKFDGKEQEMEHSEISD